ncbi:MAG: AAA domain-containing protein, partial [Cyanobacteria bacterium J06598_1]
SPYRAHANAVKRAVTRRFPQIDAKAIGTVHTFQGSEKPVMIFSAMACLSRSNLTWFDSRPNLLNVAVSRAKELFILVGNLSYLEKGRFTRRLIEHIETYGVVSEYKTEAEVTSPYDTGSNIVIQNCEHLSVFADALAKAKKSLVIVVPTVSGEPVRQFMAQVKSILDRGEVAVTVLYGTPSRNDASSGGPIVREERALKELFSQYEMARMIRLKGMGTNQRLLLCDEQFAIAGSWNWLSHRYGPACARAEIVEGVQIREETSFKQTDIATIKRIKAMIQRLK